MPLIVIDDLDDAFKIKFNEMSMLVENAMPLNAFSKPFAVSPLVTFTREAQDHLPSPFDLIIDYAHDFIVGVITELSIFNY